jgi:hypothetical protein
VTLAHKKSQTSWAHLDVLARWRELRQKFADDRETVDILDAIGRAPAKALKVTGMLFAPYESPPHDPGAPKIWGRLEQIYAWLAVETEVALIRDRFPTIGYKAALQKRYSKNSELLAWANPKLKIKSVHSALRHHRAGAKHLSASADIMARYKNILAIELAHRRSAQK